ncbi:MAG: hypothetical protein D4R55_01220 [Chitinophagaceae bacterium]|nr:MAG: hypothetical protein D4R55_01220 [Chitinophagaceae bacterium]
MKKPMLLFVLKYTVIVYFAACTSIQNFTTVKSATAVITRAPWKVNLYTVDRQDQTQELEGYTLNFKNSGELVVSKDGVDIKGNWSEGNESNRIRIDVGQADKNLKKLNNYWLISEISNNKVAFTGSPAANSDRLNIATR